MRLDKFLSVTATATRSEAKSLARAGKITVNGKIEKDASVQIDERRDVVIFCGKEVIYRQFIYIMMNKPAGYISSTDDPRQRTVLDLLPENYGKFGLFPCGRLDIDTTGLLILTNNGPLAHRLLSPKHHVPKTYEFTCSPPITEGQAEILRRGVDIGEKSPTKPAAVTLFSGEHGTVTISEGKFHQIKRMFFAVGSEITSLKRINFAGISLDENLKSGEWRELSEDEQAQIETVGQF